MALEVLTARLGRSLELTNSLADDLSAAALALHNGKAKSNTISGQFWCLVGARESYARAIKNGAWSGFSCSLDEAGDPAALRPKLVETKDLVLSTITSAGALDDPRLEFLINLNEHEVQHHGQLIRYFYANDLAFPPAFASRYALD